MQQIEKAWKRKHTGSEHEMTNAAKAKADITTQGKKYGNLQFTLSDEANLLQITKTEGENIK